MLSFVKNYYHIIILLIVATIGLCILRLSDYDYPKHISFFKEMALIFNNSKITSLYNITLNSLLTTTKYLFMFIMLIYSILYVNNSDSKMISYSLHKNNIQVNIIKILLTNIKNTLIFVSIVIITLLTYYALYNGSAMQEDITYLIYYGLKLYLICLLIVLVYDLLVVIDKEVKWYYLSTGLLIILLYLDINNKYSNILMSDNIDEDKLRITALLIINLSSLLIFRLIYQRKGDLL